MEPAELPGQISKDNFLEVPNLSDSVCEDEEVKTTFKPGFSPQPSRRGSGSSEDTYLDTPASASRRVSFADSLGFSLVSVKEFDCWELPSVSTDLGLSRDIFHTEEYVLSPLFDLPSSKEELMEQLQAQKAMLESTEYPPGSTSVKGIIRVLNVSFEKLVYVRMSLDDWQTHYDILAEYVPNSCDGETDQFSFKISLVPPYQKDGSKVEFCIRYETSVGTFWSNNNGTNYVLVCQKKKKEPEPLKPLEETLNRQIKGCLKVKSSSKEESLITSEENKFENLKFTDAYVPKIICSHEDKDDLGASHENVEDINRKHDSHNEKELDWMINQPLIITRDEEKAFSTEPVNFTNKAEGSEKKQDYHEIHTDLFRRPLSPNLPEEISLKRDSYLSRNYSPGNECGHPHLEEIPSYVGGMRPLLGDTSSAKLIQLNLCSQEVLDDNANPAHGSGRVQIVCSSSDHLMTDGLNKNNETGSKKTGIKDHKYSRSDFSLEASTNLRESNESSKDDYIKDNDEAEQNTCLGVNEKQGKNFQSIFQNEERQIGHPEISNEGTEANNEDLTTLLSKDTTATTWRATVDPSPSASTNLNWREAGKGTTLETRATHLGSPRNGNVLTGDFVLQAARVKSDRHNPEDQNMNTQHKKNWNVLESQPETRGIETNTAKQIKEQAECKGVWEKRDNKISLKGTPTEPLFTCQETECYELSSLADEGITEKAQAVTAYIIKTTLEGTPESMSARGKAIIAKLPQETAGSDRPIQVKQTAFDPHEGSKDDSHYTLCHGDTAGVIHDNDFERESHLAICNVHVDEMEKEATPSTCNPRKTYDKEKRGIGIVTSIDEPSQVITGNQKATSKLDLHLGVLPTEKATFLGNKDLGLVQELSRTDFDAVHSTFNSDTSSTSQGSHQVYRCQSENSEPSSAWLVAEEKAGTNTTLQSISTKSEYTCRPESEILGHVMSKPDDVSKTSEIMESDNGRKSPVGPILQQKEGKSLGKFHGPMILVSEPLENLEEAKSDKEGLTDFEQSQCYSNDKGSESPTSVTLPLQEAQDQCRESLLSTYINSKLPYILLFLIFLATIYYYDLMIGLAFYLFSLYWLYWEGGRPRESVKKK